MPYSTLGKNAMLDALGALAVFVSLHDGDPGESGANEIAGGSPAYARKAVVSTNLMIARKIGIHLAIAMNSGNEINKKIFRKALIIN